ncbi:MAG: hypothetical protein E6940_07660 [Clostridium septicum]|uniref:PBECR2 nuclease fold domain-containing protein n=1 Tax=Clostridium septicum TaxID=1504 RepID=UPI00258599B9|nr:PBECR2 nuclease fold domain-containing protein [Clostridium septicum]MDU1313925.1 hypothetical protein [Clostridium septicum]
MIDEEEFIESLYDEANEQLKEIYKEQKNIRNELLKEIAMVMLTYTIIDGVMSIGKSDKDKYYKKMSSLILNGHKNIGKNQIDIINDILSSTVNKTFNFYNYNANLKDVKKIVKDNFKGKHFSKRVWENEQETAKYLHKQINAFLNGKVNVNQIKKEIEKTYNTGAYNTKRLVETEVNRSSANAFDRFCLETGVKRVRYNATLDSRVCNDCSQYQDKLFDFDKKIEVPRHPLCRCFYTIEDDNKIYMMNLQLFGLDDWKALQQKIERGNIDNEKFDMCYNEFNKIFKNGLKTPIEEVKSNDRTFVHITQRHPYMVDLNEINNVKNTIMNPKAIYKTKDKYGNIANAYIKQIDEDILLVIVRNVIITAYYPENKYLKNNILKGGELLWEDK